MAHFNFMALVIVLVLAFAQIPHAAASLFSAEVDATININNDQFDRIMTAYDKFPEKMIEILNAAEGVGHRLIEDVHSRVHSEIKFVSCDVDIKIDKLNQDIGQIASQIPFAKSPPKCGPYSLSHRMLNGFEPYGFEKCLIRKLISHLGTIDGDVPINGQVVARSTGYLDSSVKYLKCWHSVTPPESNALRRVRESDIYDVSQEHLLLVTAWHYAPSGCKSEAECARGAARAISAKLAQYPSHLTLKSELIGQVNGLFPICNSGVHCFANSAFQWVARPNYEKRMKAAARAYLLLRMEYEKFGNQEIDAFAKQAESGLSEADGVYAQRLEVALVDDAANKLINGMHGAANSINALSIENPSFDSRLGQFSRLVETRNRLITAYNQTRTKFNDNLSDGKTLKRPLADFKFIYVRCKYADGSVSHEKLTRLEDMDCSAPEAVLARLKTNIINRLPICALETGCKK